MMKRILSFLVTLCMTVCAFTVADAALGGECGDVNWKLNTATGLLTIYGEGEMDFEDDAPWYSYKDVIKKAVIEDGVEYICSYAFCDCYNLTRVEIGADVCDIDMQVFGFCISLSEIYVDEDNEYYCSVDGNLFDKEKEVMIKYAPGKDAVSYRVPDGTIELENDVFGEMNTLERVEIPSSVEYLDSFNFECSWGLKEICVDEDNKYYCSMDGVLFDKDMTTLIKYPSAKSDTHYGVPDGVECIVSFDWASELKSLYISDSVTKICEEAFWCCENLEKIRIPMGLDLIEDYAFFGCTGLKDVYFEGSEAQWKQIEIGHDNECLTEATIHYSGAATAPMIIDAKVLSTKKIEIELEGYEAGGVVVGIMMDGNKTLAVRNKAVAEKVEIDFDGVTGNKVKIFWWKDLKSLLPLCEAMEVEVD